MKKYIKLFLKYFIYFYVAYFILLNLGYYFYDESKCMTDFIYIISAINSFLSSSSLAAENYYKIGKR